MSYSWPARAKKANCRARSVLPPRGRCTASSSPRSTVQPWAWGPGPHIRRLACRFLCVEKTDRRVRSMPPPTVAHLFASAKSNSPVSNTGAQARESYSSGAGPWVQRSQTTARANTVPPRGAAEDGEVKFLKLMWQYRGTARMAQRDRQIRKSWVSQPRG
jgi:hypothetical protein